MFIAPVESRFLAALGMTTVGIRARLREREAIALGDRRVDPVRHRAAADVVPERVDPGADDERRHADGAGSAA
jgi:hypothetical protein